MTALIAIGIGVVFLAVGIASYGGWWRSWASPGRGWYAPGFGMLYVGIAAILAGILVMVVDVAPRGIVIAGVVVMTGLFVLGILSLFWLPAFLTPRWFRDRRRGSSSTSGLRWGGRS